MTVVDPDTPYEVVYMDIPADFFPSDCHYGDPEQVKTFLVGCGIVFRGESKTSYDKQSRALTVILIEQEHMAMNRMVEYYRNKKSTMPR